MRILHVLDHSLPLHSGYTFRTRAIMSAQAAAGLAVAGVTGPRHEIESASGGAAEETHDGLRFFRGGAAPGGPPVLAEWREIRAFADTIEAAARVFKPDVLHAHSPVLTALAARIAARRLGLPLVYEIRAFWEDASVGNGTGREGSLRYRATAALETYACRRVDHVAVICEGLRADLVRRGIPADRILVSPNGVDLTLFAAAPPPDEALRAELGLAGAETIGFIGSFYDYEGIDDLIAAMPALVAARPAAHLLLVGGGPRADALKAQAAASPVADRIRFVGRVPHSEVERYYGLVDILCYPRKRMRLTDLVTPLKPLEAMAQRRLVAASDVGGHRELIEDGVTGTLFAPDDPDAIAAALAATLADRGGWEARRDAGLAFVRAERDWSRNATNYLPVYHDLAARMVHDDAGEARMAGKSLIRRIDAWRFERPLAAALAVSALFAMLAMPASRYAALPLVGSLPQGAGAVLVALLLAVAGWVAMRRPARAPVRRRRVAPAVADAAAAPVARSEAEPKPEAEPTLRLRRADRHPDAPAREPIRAHRDLGSPFMEVDTTPRPTVIDLPLPPLDLATLTVATSAPEPAAIVAVPEPAAVVPIVAEPIAPHTTDVPAAAPAAPPREAARGRTDLGAMIDRLAAGLSARAADAVTRPPSPALVDALEELNRIAARRR